MVVYCNTTIVSNSKMHNLDELIIIRNRCSVVLYSLHSWKRKTVSVHVTAYATAEWLFNYTYFTSLVIALIDWYRLVSRLGCNI